MTPEEIQNWIADHENRISFLENSLPGSAMTPKEDELPWESPPEKPWMKNQWHRVEQAIAEMLNLKGKFLDLEKLVISKGYNPRYKEYSN